MNWKIVVRIPKPPTKIGGFAFWRYRKVITKTGVELYRWYQMGITELEDLKWVLEFYRQEQYPMWFVGAELQTAKAWFKELKEMS